jgi:biotin carboxylase
VTRAKTLLILGGGPDQLPTYRAARRLGCTIIGADQRADAPAAAIADRFLPISTRHTAAIIRALGEARIDGVVAPASDASQPALQALADYYDTPWRPSPKALLSSIDKGVFRQVLEGLPYPRCRFAQSVATGELVAASLRMRYPLVVKPADASGCRGVGSAEHPGELPTAIEAARGHSFSGEVIVEEMAAGQHLTAECFVRDGRPALIALMEMHNSGPPRFLTRFNLLPARVDAAAERTVAELIESLCRTLKIECGSVNFDLVLDERGNPYPVEVNARMGGNGLAHMIRTVYGVDLPELAIRLALGEPFELSPRRRGVAMSCVLGADRDGVLQRVEGVEAVRALPTTLDLEIFSRPGDRVRAHTESGHKLGVLVLAGEEHEQVLDAYERARRTIRFHVGDAREELGRGDAGDHTTT